MTINTSDIIALGALSVSIFSLAFSYFNSRNLNKQQKQINDFTIFKQKKDEDHSKKAHIEAKCIPNGGSVTIKICNKGQSTAKNIQLEFPYNDKDGIFCAELPFPFPQINANSYGPEFYIHLADGHTNPVEFIFSWEDDFSKSNKVNQWLYL